MKTNFDFNRLSESRKQELDRMAADFSEAGCRLVEDLFLEFLIDANNGIDRSDDKLVATFDDECGHELVFILSQEEVHYCNPCYFGKAGYPDSAGHKADRLAHMSSCRKSCTPM